MRRTVFLLLAWLVAGGAAMAQVPRPGLLNSLKPFLPPATLTRGFTYIDVADRPEYIYDYTVGAAQSRVILVQKQNPRLYLLVPTVEEAKVPSSTNAIHNGYIELLTEDETGQLHKVFDSHAAFGDRLLNHSEIGFADLDGDGIKEMVMATQFSSETGGLSSALFVYAWDTVDQEYRKMARDQQQGEYSAGLRLVPTSPGGSPQIFVTRTAGESSTRMYWWLYGYEGHNLKRRQWAGPIPGRAWIAMVGPSHSYRVIVARWVPMDTPQGRFMDKSEVTFYTGSEPAEKYYTFRDPFELTKEVPRDVPIPDDLWPFYFSPHLVDHLPRRRSILGEEIYALFPEKARPRTALNFQINGKAYTALAYILWKVKDVSEPTIPSVDGYIQRLPYPHQVVDQIKEGNPCAQIQVTPQVQIKVMIPTGHEYKELWTSPAFPEGHLFDGFEVDGDTLYGRFFIHGDLHRAPLPFLRS